jgi:hypothetical protein
VTDDDLAMSELVLFELPTRGDVELFCAALRPRWRGRSTVDGDVWLVTVELHPEGEDLANLLRKAEGVIADLGLDAIHFCVDDRAYCLEPRAGVAVK